MVIGVGVGEQNPFYIGGVPANVFDLFENFGCRGRDTGIYKRQPIRVFDQVDSACYKAGEGVEAGDDGFHARRMWTGVISRSRRRFHSQCGRGCARRRLRVREIKGLNIEWGAFTQMHPTFFDRLLVIRHYRRRL